MSTACACRAFRLDHGDRDEQNADRKRPRLPSHGRKACYRRRPLRSHRAHVFDTDVFRFVENSRCRFSFIRATRGFAARERSRHDGSRGFPHGYSGALTAAAAIAVLAGFAPRRSESFDRLKVQRIDVVEPDGTLRMVISDHAHLPGMIVKGKESPMPRPQAGMLFYDDEGTENGGLIFGGRKNEKGEVVDSGGSLSFDKYGANQIVQLIGVDDKEDRFAGLAVVDSPTGADTRRRAWVGRRDDGTASVELRDGNGRKRLVLSVGAAGETSLAFLDATGKVVRKITPETTAETH